MAARRLRQLCGLAGPRVRGVQYRRLRFEVLEQRGMLSSMTPLEPLPGDLGTDERLLSDWAEVAPLSAQQAPAIVNHQVTDDPGVQQMPSIAVDPHDSEHLVLAYMDYSLPTADTDLPGEGYAGIGVAVSYDAGDTWQHTSIALPTAFDQGAANPIVRFDDQGHVFVGFMAATFLGPLPPLTNPDYNNPARNASDRAYGNQANNGIFVARSDDGGRNWSAPVAVASHRYEGQDVPFEVTPDIAIDTFAKLPNGRPNPNYGSIYAVWTRLYAKGLFPGHPEINGGGDIMVAVSRDRGGTWETQLQEKWNDRNGDGIRQDDEVWLASVIEDPANTRGAPGLTIVDHGRVAVGTEGEIYVSNWGGGDFTVHFSNDAAKSFAIPSHSTGSRVAFGPGQVSLVDATGLPNNRFRTHATRAIATDPTRPGHVYALEPFRIRDAAGNLIDGADIFFARSSDYGETWIGAKSTERVVLNDDNDRLIATGLRPDEVISGQALTRLAVDDKGNIAIIWYDTRRDPADHLLDVFGTVSTDGGETFSPNFRMTDRSFDADQGRFTDATGGQNYYLGDAIRVAMGDHTAFAAWTDTRSGNQDIFFSRYAVDPPPGPPNDRFEPNQTQAQPTPLGRVIRRLEPKLALPGGDEDWFRFEAAATGDVIISAVQSQAGRRLRLELWDAEATRVLANSADVFHGTGEVIGQKIVFPGAAAQGYLLHVLPGEASQGSTDDRRYSIEVQSLTADLGTRVYGEVDDVFAPGNDRFYLLSAGASGSLQVLLTSGENVQGNLNLEVFDTEKLSVLAKGSASGDAGAGEVEEARFAIKEGQAVLLHVSGDDGSQGGFGLRFIDLDQFTASGSAALFVPAGAGPSQAASGDLNRDGKRDMVVANGSTDTITVLLGNGDGTFQAPRQFTIGALVTPSYVMADVLPNLGRDLRIGDVSGDGIPDVVATNFDSSDVSVLLGRGDGTFEPQRRFDATGAPFALEIGDLNGDTRLDLVVVDSSFTGAISVAALLGRGDGTFRPQRLISLPTGAETQTTSVRIAELNGDGKPDLVVSGSTMDLVWVLLGNGDGTFAPTAQFPAESMARALAMGDINGDGKMDILNASWELNTLSLLLGNGDGTFQSPKKFRPGQAPVAMEIADLGSEVTVAGRATLGPPDGRPDLVVANAGIKFALESMGPPQVVVLPGVFDSKGQFLRFGLPQELVRGNAPSDVDLADFNRDGILDVAAVDRDGVLVVFRQPPVIVPNDTPQTARDLGTVVHLMLPTLTIVPGHEDAYYRLTVPAEALARAGEEVVDFSGLFQYTEGAGLGMEVRDSAGNLLGSGERFRVQAAQGEELLLHVFGVDDGQGVRGAGAYTLVIDVLPQVVAIQAEALLPGIGGRPGGPTTNLVITLQGDRLDPATAEDPANYTVTFVGADGQARTADDRTIPLSSIVYNPGANVEVSSGRTYPTAVRQTVTLVFDRPLPAGSYLVELSPRIQAAAFNEAEADLLADPAHFAGHPVVSRVAGGIGEGARLEASDLVLRAGALGDLGVFERGTRFLTQFQNDLGARLDALLTQLGDAASITDAIRAQILERIVPGLGDPGQRPTSMMVLFLDPVSIGLVAPNRSRLDYDLQTNTLSNQLAKTFVEVGGNVEVIVVGGAKGSYQLNVADVPAHTRGVAVLLGPSRDVVVPLTAAIREGQRSFVLSMEAAPPSPNPIGPAAVAAATVASPVATMTNLVVAPSQPALPPSSGESGAAHGTGALASSPSSTDFLLEDGTGGGGMVLPEGQDREGGGPARAPEKQGGNPPEPGSLLEWLQDLWEMLRSLLPVPRLNRP